MTLTAIGCDLSPAEVRARIRRALQHLSAAPIGAGLVALVGSTGVISWSQVAESAIGAGLTYLVHNAPGKVRAYSQAVVPVLFAVITAATAVAEHGKLSGLPWAVGILPALHLLTAAWNRATPTARRSTRASRTASQVVATLGQETAVADIAAPMTAREGGEHQAATRTATTALPKLTPEVLAAMDAERATQPPPQASETTSTTSTPDQAPPATSATTTSTPAGFAPSPPSALRRPGLRQPNGDQR